jgi:hypothetical protein
MSNSVRNMRPTTNKIPATPKPTIYPSNPNQIIPVSKIYTYLWKRVHTKAMDWLEKYEENMAKDYIIIYHQCSPALKNDLDT